MSTAISLCRYPSKFSILPTALVLLAAGCSKQLPAPTERGEFALQEGPGRGLPQVVTPELRATPAPEVHLERLPPDLQRARTSISSSNVQRVSMVLQPRAAAQQSSREVFDQVIAPLLLAVGFAQGNQAFRLPPEGVEQPRANLAASALLLEEQRRSEPVPGRPNPVPTLDALTGRTQNGSPVVDERLQRAAGVSVAQLRADFDRLELVYPFGQMVGDVPIEHTALVAVRREGQTVSSVSGTLIHDYELLNERPASDALALQSGQRALSRVHGLEETRAVLRGEEPVLVVLPYGNAASGRVALRYAWRMLLDADVSGRPASFRAWVDAQTGAMLKLEPLTASVGALGNTWRRDPGTGGAVVRTFEVDTPTPTSPNYELRLGAVSTRVDFKGDNNTGNDLVIPGSGGGSSTVLANFNQPPFNDAASAKCASGGNEAFQQVNFFALLQSNRLYGLYNGMYFPFPVLPWQPKLQAEYCDASSNMYFGVCPGYMDAACPNYSTGPVVPAGPAPISISYVSLLNFAQDASIVAHEVAHEAIQRLTTERPVNWCRTGSCQVPIGWFALHDLADVWADHVENTNCVGGWVAKNVGGADASRDCVGPNPLVPIDGRHFEHWGLPRRHELDVPFQPATPRDHFPEHRAIATGDYADMQIAAAVLWQLREGMVSRLGLTGNLLYFSRLLAAIKATGMSGTTPGTTDFGIYTYLQDLEFWLTQQWASPGAAAPASTNEVLAAFARGGLFVMPPVCLDGNAATSDTGFCPGPVGEDGADAVVDVDDNDASDDALIDAVRHIDGDVLRAGGPRPTFHVWTGSRFRFDPSSGQATVAGTSPCNAQFRVEASTNPTFPAAKTVSSGLWTPVDVDSSVSDGKECYGSWTPSESEWLTLQALGAPSAIYYRAFTSNAAGGNVRSSTLPGNGSWNVPPAIALLTSDGTVDL